MSRLASLAVAVLLLACVGLAQQAGAQAPKPLIAVPLIMDTDIGSSADDALALALILQSPEVDVKLITTVTDDVESRTRLAWKELGIYGRQDIPLATGAAKPIDEPSYRSFPGHAAQFSILTAEDRPPETASRNAAQAIVETLRASSPENQAKMIILAVGPLTNIALALRLDPQIKDKIDRIVLMGGVYFRQKREDNIAWDPIAADVVFRSGVPITAVGLEITDYFRLESQFVEQIRDAHTPGADFLYRLIQLWQEGDSGKLPVLYDPVTAAVVLKPSLIQTISGTVEVETHDPTFLGITRFTQATGETRGPVEVARGVSAEDLIRMFMERVTGAPRRLTSGQK